MYTHLFNELKKHEISNTLLAGLLGISLKTLKRKLLGQSDWNIDEALKIKSLLDNLTIEYLFAQN